MKLKVIGGRLKGKPLASLKGRAVRPTAGRVREAIFNILASRVDNAVTLDLFAGTGALGIEALSRGAARAVFVDYDQAALAVIKQNIVSCDLESAAITLRHDVTRSLSGLNGLNLTFDLVFMDPPYNQQRIRPALTTLTQSGQLNAGSLVVMEHSSGELFDDESGVFNLSDRRKYGRAIVSFLEYMPEYMID